MTYYIQLFLEYLLEIKVVLYNHLLLIIKKSKWLLICFDEVSLQL